MFLLQQRKRWALAVTELARQMMKMRDEQARKAGISPYQAGKVDVSPLPSPQRRADG
jgi:hypothetical protein